MLSAGKSPACSILLDPPVVPHRLSWSLAFAIIWCRPQIWPPRVVSFRSVSISPNSTELMNYRVTQSLSFLKSLSMPFGSLSQEERDGEVLSTGQREISGPGSDVQGIAAPRGVRRGGTW